MRYFLYCRKSSDREDRQILGPEAQRRLLLEYAERHRLTVAQVYVEHQTAYKVGRPLFSEMLERLEKGEADGILTYHLTRLARNSFDGGRIIYMMDEGVVREITTPEKTYINNADDKFMMQIHFAMAKKSSDDTSQFVRRDVESKLLRGEYPGQVPIGYLNINRDGHISKAQDNPEKYMQLLKLGRPLKREEIDPVDGPLVKKLFLEAATGTYSVPQLRKLSERLGLRARKTRKTLCKNVILRLLSDPYYYGVLRSKGKIYDDAFLQAKTGDANARIQHEPLISKALFEDVQKAIRYRAKGRYRKHTYAFGGCIIRCGSCGGVVTAEDKKGHVYYHCTHNHGPCDQVVWTREETIEEQMASFLIRLRLPQAYLDYALARLSVVHASETAMADAQRRKLQSELNAVQQKLDGLLQLKISAGNADGSMLSDEEYVEQKTVLKRNVATIQEQLTSISQQSDTWMDDCEQFFSFTQKLAMTFSEAGPEDKRVLLQLVCSNLALKDQNVAVVYKEPYATLAEFPLAGKDENTPSEPEEVQSLAENPEIADKWLRVLTAIRDLHGNVPTVAFHLYRR